MAPPRLPPITSYEDLMPLFERYCDYMEKALPPEERADYRQDMFLGLMRGKLLEKIDPSDRERVKSYLNQALRNLTSNWHRGRERRWGLTDLVDPLTPALDLPGMHRQVLAQERLRRKLRRLRCSEDPEASAAS